MSSVGLVRPSGLSHRNGGRDPKASAAGPTPLHESPEAEAALLGAVLVKGTIPDAVLDVTDGMSVTELFVDVRNRAAWAAATELHAQGDAVDPLSIAARAQGACPDASLAYLAGLLDALPTSANAAHYARLVREAALRRRHDELVGRLAAFPHGSPGLRETLAALHALQDSDRALPEPAPLADWLRQDPPVASSLFEGTVPLGALSGVDAQGGTGKSMLSLELAVSVATGRVLLDMFRPVRPRTVILIESEDPPEEMHRRLARVVRAFGLCDDSLALLTQNLRLHAGWRFPVGQHDAHGALVPSPDSRQLRRMVRQHQPGLLILDPLAHFLGGCDENDNVQRAAFMNLLADLTREVEEGMAVWLAGHTSKQREDELTSAMGRGAVAHRDAMRSLYAMAPVSDKEREKLGLPPEGDFVRLAHVKANWSARASGVHYLRRDHVPETAGVLRQVDVEVCRAELSSERLGRIARALVEALGANPGGHTERDLLRGPEGEKFRSAVRAAIAPEKVTNEELKQAFARAREVGLVQVDTLASGKARRQVPRQA